MQNRGHVYVLPIGERERDRTVLELLVRRFAHSVESEWAERIRAGRVRIGGRPVEAGRRLRAGERLEWHRPAWVEPPAPRGFALRAADADHFVVVKPPGLPCLPGAQYLEHTLLHQVRRLDPSADLVHRLGRGTSGLVLVARSDAARRAFAADLRERRIGKEYRALVTGHVAEPRCTVDVPIGPVARSGGPPVFAADAAGRPARSHLEVIEHRESTTLLRVRIETGRPHQIRVHCAAVGHPLVGDPLYECGGRPRSDSDALPGDVGYALHAYGLEYRHPRTGEARRVLAPVPAGHWARSRNEGTAHGEDSARRSSKFE